MQNSFSKCREWVPRGTSQHKWRWLTTLLLILTLGIGQMWGADPTSTYDVSDLISAGTITTSTTNDDLDQTIENVVYDWNKGGSSSNVRISSQRVQLFGDGQSLTISTSSDYRIKSIRFAVGNKSNSPTAIKESADAGTWAPAFTSSAFSNGNYTFTVTTPTAGGSYTFTIFKSGGTNQRADFDDIVVTYDVAPSDHPTVTYYPNGATSGTVPVDANSPYSSGDNVTVLGNSGNLAKTGMEFVGWNTSADGSGASYLAGNVISDVKANIKLYAQWAYPATGTGTITYALTYDKNEVTPSVSGVSTLSSSSTAFTLSSLTIGVNSDKKPGYSAKIENATADENRNVALQFTVADGYTFAPSDVSMTIFANSTSYMKAKVVLSDGVTTVQSEELECANSADSNIEFASGAFTGKKFVGNVSVTVYLWLTSGSGKRAYIKSPVTITGTVAAAAPKYDVVFANGGEGTGDMATLKYEAGKVVTLPACGYTPASGREFNGWTSSDVTISAGKFEMPAKNVTITATWRDEAVKYTVAYDVNGGSSATPTETDKAAGDEFALAAAPEYDGYHFEGWLCNADAVTYDAEDAYTMTAANTTFTAQWKPYSTISIANKTYIIGIGDFNAVSDFSSNCEAAVSYELKESYPGVTLTPAGVFSATAAGEYIVVANQAGDATYAATSKEFTVTVLDNELSDIYIWSKASKYGGDGKCISATDANKDANANAASTTLNYSALAMDGMTSMGRPGGDAVVTLTFSVKGDYSSLFGIKSICTMGKLEEPAGGQISWDNGTTWTALDAYGSGDGEVKTFNAPTGVFPASFKIKFVSASTSVGGLYWRNALVTLEAKKTVTSTVVELNNVKVNGTAISGSELSSLLTNKTLDLATVYTTAPTVTFVKRTTVNYAGGWPADETDENIDVNATDATTNWSASQLINENNYTVTLAKPTVPSLITEATGFTLTSTKVAKDTETFTFSGMNLTSGNVTIALESAVAGMTVSPAEVTPAEGVITDQEVTITYKSVEDVAEANVNLVVYYDADTKIVLPLTYSSTAGIVDLTPISASTTWNWDHANSSTDAIESLDANEIVVFANYSGWVDAFKANSIAGKLQYVYRGNNYAQGHNLKFNTTVPGIVTVTFSNTSNKEVARAPRITDVNGSYAPTDEADGAKTADAKSYSHAVAAGDVLIEGFEMQEGTPANMLRFYEVRFVPTFSVTYKPNGGTGAEYIDDNATEVAEGLFTAPASSAFVEWNTQADGNGDSYLPGAAVTADLELYAQWETSYTVTFDLQGHGDAIDPQNIVSGGKVVKPADPSADEWEFGGWYKESTCENEWDFATDVVTTTTTIFAKWTADPCPTPFSLSKVVLTSASEGTVTGYNNDEYAGEAVIGGLKDDDNTADVDPSHEGVEEGYKLNGGGSGIVFATLKKGNFQEGDRVIVTITAKQNSYKIEEVSQDVLHIYYGTNASDATKLTTLESVSTAGSYTYRLKAADITAIGTKKGIGVFRESSNGQNPYVYSVEIKGCREWAVSHQVTFDKMGHGADIDPQTVPEGDKIAKPSVVEPEGWAFAGWYKENTLENEWDFATDVMGTIDMTLYAKWEDETSAIKLIVDGTTPGTKKINDEAYYTGSPLTSVTISEVVTPCVKLPGGAAAATAPYSADKNDNRVIAYCAQTTQTKIRVIAYSDNNNPRPYTISFVEEGQTADQADDNNVIVNLPTDGTIHTSDWYQFNSSKNRTIYITIPGNASNYHFLQVKVIESGTPIKKAGDLGYSMNFNIGRPIGVKQTLHKNFEGFDFYANNDYKVLQSTSMVISNATNDYIKFHAAAPMTLAVTTENAASFYVTKAAKGTDNETLSTEGGISYIDLDEAADWYISPKGGDLKIQKIEFIAPKCEQPTMVDMENIGLCEGDAFTALTVSASVSDGGTLHYQWYKHPAAGDDEAVGTDAASYTPETDGQYYVVVTNQLADHSDNSKASNTVTVEHFASAVITTAPLNQRGEVGDVVTLSAAATGKNVAYKWYTCDEDGSNEVALDPAQTGPSIDVTITAGLLQWYKVKVTSDCGGAEAKAKVSEFVPTTPANVTTSILWDWTSSAWPASGEVPFTNKTEDGTDLTPAYELLADADAIVPNNAAFRSDMLYGKGQWVWRSGNKFFQGTAIKFNTTVAGMVRVYYRSTGNNKEVQVTIAGTPAGKNKTSNFQWSEYVEVPAGDVEILCLSTDAEKSLTRVQKIEFLALEDRRADTWVKPGELGTVCLENDAMVMGANIYALAGLDENGYLAFNQIMSGELEAGKPYLFEATRSGNVSFYKTLNAGHADEAGVTNGMHGTFSNKTFSPNTAESEGIYYFSGTHIWKVDDFSVSITVPAYRCYVDYDAVQAAGPAQAPAAGCRRVTLGVNGKNNATDVENLNASEAPVKLIIDGKMYILRGEKLFDATGRLVK